MKRRPVRASKRIIPVAFAGGVFLAGCGTFFPQPEDPADPPAPGEPQPIDPDADLPGMNVTILDVNGGRSVQPGGWFQVDFSLKTNDGETIPIEDLDRFSIYASGPSNNFNRVIVPVQNPFYHLTRNLDGSYHYSHATPFPDAYPPPANDSEAYGPEDNELSGTRLMNGSYAVGIEARRSFLSAGEVVRDAGDASFDFSVGNAPLILREVVARANCNNCHTRLTIHGGNRFSVTNCVLCHTAGAEDRVSGDPAKATPGVTIELTNLIHRLHRGADLPTIRATENSGSPDAYEVIGFGESVHDYSHVNFPATPGGTGFDEQTRNCQACHAGAADGERAFTNPRRSACGGCHNDIDWTTGTKLDPDNPNVIAGTLTREQLSDPANRVFVGGLVHTFNDGQCLQCHNSSTPSLDPAVVHVPPLADSANTIGLKVEILSVAGNSGMDYFQVGDFPAVTFQLLDRGDQPVDISAMSSVRLVMGGPVESYQRIFPTIGTSPVSIKGAGGVPTTGLGPFTYTSQTAIPAAYPLPLNYTGAFDYAGGWGERNGRPLVDGNYTFAVYAYRQFELAASPGTFYRETASAATAEIRIGTSGPLSGYAGYVTDQKCNACHGGLTYHGSTRKGVKSCVLCHTGGSEDRPGSGAQAPEPDTIDFKVLIHKIHNARELQTVKDGGAYDLVGFGNELMDFSHALLPAMPGGAKNCVACHATDSWKEPAERADANVWRVACTACHDSATTLAHVALQTDDNPTPGEPGIESCSVCHGSGAAFSVEKSHRIR